VRRCGTPPEPLSVGALIRGLALRDPLRQRAAFHPLTSGCPVGQSRVELIGGDAHPDAHLAGRSSAAAGNPFRARGVARTVQGSYNSRAQA